MGDRKMPQNLWPPHNLSWCGTRKCYIAMSSHKCTVLEPIANLWFSPLVSTLRAHHATASS